MPINYLYNFNLVLLRVKLKLNLVYSSFKNCSESSSLVPQFHPGVPSDHSLEAHSSILQNVVEARKGIVCGSC